MQILVIGLRIPTPNMDAGSYRIYNLLIMLQEMFSNVSFVSHFPESWSPFDKYNDENRENLKKAGIKIPPVKNISSFMNYIKKHGSNFDTVILSDIEVAAAYIDIIREYSSQAFILFDTVDLHHIRYFREAKQTGNINAMKRALQVKHKELDVARKADCTIVVSTIEKTILQNEHAGLPVHILSIIHNSRNPEIPFLQRKDLLFVGSFQHSPNIDAVHYFLEDIFPLIKKEIPEIKAYIVGSKPTDSIKAFASEDIIVTGYIENITPLLKKCRISVAPLRFGAGIKGKVLESISYSLPVVGSSIAVEGTYLKHEHDVLIGDNPEEFSRAVIKMYENSKLWNKISKNGLETLSRHFSSEVFHNSLVNLFDNLEKGDGNGLTSRERDNACL